MNISELINLSSFIEWTASSWLSHAIGQSQWAFAVIESIHLLALAVIGGAVLIVDLKLLGYGIRTQTLAEVARDAQQWFLGSWAVMIVSGTFLFISEPQKLYYSGPFAMKMLCLLLGTVFALTVRRKVTLSGEGRVSPAVRKLVALVSLVLWFGVGAGGRWIGFSG
jgi:putative copper export protein